MGKRAVSTAKHFAPKHAYHLSASRVKEWVESRENFVFAVISGLWVLALYGSVIHAPFAYDDIDQIQKNPSILGLGTALHYFCSSVFFTDNFRGFGGSFYRPLFWLSLAVDHKLWGLNAVGFHITNIVLHWITGILGFFLLRRLGASLFVSAISSLLWLGLPVNSEVVAWVSGRTYSLMTLFLLLALLSAEWYRRRNNILSVLSYFFAALAAILCHEEGVLVLPLTFLLLYSMDRFRSRRAYLLLGIAGTSVLAIFLWLRQIAGTQRATAGSSQLLPLGAYFIKYLGWMILPIRMSVERSTDAPADSVSFMTVGAWVGTGLLFLLVYRLRNRTPAIASGLAWMCIGLLPFCGIIFIYQGMAERFDYLASAGLCFSIVALLSLLPKWRIAGICVVAMWAIWGVWRLETRLLEWRDPISLYKASLEATPRSATLSYDLGAVFEKQGDLKQAARYYEHTLELNSRYENAIAGLGNIYLRSGAIDQAKAAFEQALSINPDDVTTLVNYGVALQRLGNLSEAKRQDERAISIKPDNANAYCNLGVVLFQLGDTDAAVEKLLHAVELEPSRTTAYFDLAAIYRKMGQTESAAAMYRHILQINPNEQEAAMELQKIAR